MKGFRKLRVGEVIREGDVFLNSDKQPMKAILCRVLFNPELHAQHYRPLPAKKVQKWTYETRADIFWTIFDGEKKPRARVWSLSDARLIVRCVNKCLEA